MTKLEQIEFENFENFKEKLNKLLKKEDIFRTFTNKENKVERKLIGRNGRLLFDNGFSFCISQANNGKVYLSIDYFSVDDRIAFWKRKQEEEPETKDLF